MSSRITINPKLISSFTILSFLCLLSASNEARCEENIANRLPDNLSVVISLNVEKALESDLIKAMPVEVLEVILKQQIGIDLGKLKRVIVGYQFPSQTVAPQMIVLGEMSADVDPKVLLPSLPGERQPIKLGKGIEGFVARQPGLDLAITVVNKQLIVAGTDEQVRNAVNAKPNPTNKIQQRLNVVDSSYPLSVMIDLANVPIEYKQLTATLINGQPIPPNIQLLAAKFLQLDAAQVNMSFQLNGLNGELNLEAINEDAALELKKLMTTILGELRQMAIAQSGDLDVQDPMINAALRKYIQRITGEFVDSLEPSLDGSNLRFKGKAATGAIATGTLVGLLLPAVSAARNAARRVVSQNNLKQIGIAFYNYEDVFRQSPTGESDRVKYKDGKPLLSWRVHILPFLEQDALYQRFKLDEPWDSPHNLPLSKMVVPVYQDLRYDLPPGMTTYQIPFGKNTLMGRHEKTTINDAVDGPSRTIMTVNVGPDRAVPWTKPVDWEFDSENPIASIGKLKGSDQFQVGLADGAVFELPLTIDPDLLLNLLIRNDGKPTSGWEGLFR